MNSFDGPTSKQTSAFNKNSITKLILQDITHYSTPQCLNTSTAF